MSGHTPGPWRWLGPSLIGDHGRRPAILCGGQAGVVTRGEDGRLRPIEGDDPNARLIAAAPDLLEALKETYHGSVERDDHIEISKEGFGLLCSAIAKAEGSAE